MSLVFDHIAISAQSLDEGAAWVEAALGVPLAGGGKHPHMATHNRLLGLGDLYLEVIAPDPDARHPGWPRWFNLDHFQGPPRLTNWVCRTDDLDQALAAAPPGAGTPVDLQRGDFRWRMAVPADGRLPLNDAYPALIEWQGSLHPTKALPDAGVRLTQLEISLPEAEALQHALGPEFNDPRVVIRLSPHKHLRATFSTPHGTRVLT
ncbi:VOC family protein [Tabrizicola sp.]|uniref:VOC family protein n=1 Tax=Tabrizicola sp. TaxID=2005166 RepID=UPI003F3F5CBC